MNKKVDSATLPGSKDLNHALSGLMNESITFHIIARTPDQEWFPVPLKDAWAICLTGLTELRTKDDFELISFILMSNHYHMLAKAPHHRLNHYIRDFHRNLPPELRFETGLHAEPIFSRRYLARCYRYIYQNPIRAGICRRCEHYPYSTLHYIVRNQKFPIQVYDRFGVKDEFRLHWVNQSISSRDFQSLNLSGSGKKLQE